MSTSLDINLYNEYHASIKDYANDLNLSEKKWDELFDVLSRLFDNIYFVGNRRWAFDDDFGETVNSICQQMLIQEGSAQKNRVMFQVKDVAFLYKRKHIAALWNYYEFPKLIFLGDKDDENELVEAIKKKQFTDDILKSIDYIVTLFRLGEPDVLWMKSNIDLQLFLNPKI